ncbi:hypothetical protein CMUS01_09690 [Colletotrichum musicola]|uniref:DUF2235 domain-containing protein n=1 Tax=Colletotrichum musicola TaxID=2175873 RepID=A0A8H6K694_9PEZI|nr:hypothetical protein CMUS01_09690 [Colletotrichum musicola]
MSTKPSFNRIVVCVDGTWYNPDGQEGRSCGNQSNVFRIFASVQDGIVNDEDGNRINQLNKGITGDGCAEQIREMLTVRKPREEIPLLGLKRDKFCCREIQTEKDEVWLFGFSRGAYVVRVVAALLHRFPLKNAPECMSTRVWERLRNLLLCSPAEMGMMAGQEHLFRLENCRKTPPRIMFLGLFDTVKKASRKREFKARITDTSFIEHARHALALNEERILFPILHFEANDYDQGSGNAKDHLEAWFMGAHADMGGGAQHDGLSLYPLHWMFIETEGRGLVFGYSDIKTKIQNPLNLVFPIPPSLDALRSCAPQAEAEPWTFQYSNKISVTMFDLRTSHMHGNLQEISGNMLIKTKAGDPRIGTHKVTISRGFFSWPPGKREIFIPDNIGTLRGYNDASSNGIIIHPSVYLLLNNYAPLRIPKALEGLYPNLKSFRDRARLTCTSNPMRSKSDPWNRDLLPWSTSCQILICGLTGVGKSTLLNRVFGIQMTQAESDQRGHHDIERAFESDQHPGIIIHDSKGYQAGNDKEFTAFKRFLRSRSYKPKASQNLHAIWLCIDTDKDLPVQSALVSILRKVASIAPTTPIVIVGTKKDMFLRLQEDESDTEMAENSLVGSPTTEERLLLRKQKVIERQFRDGKDTCSFWSQLDVKFAFVSKDDEASIRSLIRLTMESLNDPEASDAICRAQVLDINAKIDLAVESTLRLLKAVIASATAGESFVMANMISTPTISGIICDEIALGCFGIPKANILGLDAILAGVVWKDLAPFMAQCVTQSVVIRGDVNSLTAFTFAGGTPPAATARMITKCACDLILILDQAFRDRGKSVSCQKVQQVAKMYIDSQANVMEGDVEAQRPRGWAVHAEIDRLIPLVSTSAFDPYREASATKYRQDINDILKRYEIQIPTDSDNDDSTERSNRDTEADTEGLSIAEDRDDVAQFPWMAI